MGLDMYLYRKTYVQNWEHMKPEERTTVTVVRDGQPLAPINPERVSYIVEEVAYWRKANAIHKWFVDECQEARVSREQLQELLDKVTEVLATAKTLEGMVTNGYRGKVGGGLEPIREPGTVIANSEKVAAILPTQSGFFFGSTDYDGYYLQDLERTRDMLEKILAEPECGEFFYHSSW